MKGMIVAVLLMAAPAAPALGAPSAAAKDTALASQDPLMRQILHRQVTQRNGGITAAVRVGSGQSIELQIAEPDAKPAEELKDALNSASESALSGLKPVDGLVAQEKAGRPAEAKAVKPAAQLKAISKTRKDWGEARKTAKAEDAGSDLVSLD